MEEGGRRGGWWGGWVQDLDYSFSLYVHIVSMLFRVLFFYRNTKKKKQTKKNKIAQQHALPSITLRTLHRHPDSYVYA
jgi:hypothetical protein